MHSHHTAHHEQHPHLPEVASITLPPFNQLPSAARGSGELPRYASLLLAWEGALLAGLFLAAIGHVAVGIYMTERFDERVRWGDDSAGEGVSVLAAFTVGGCGDTGVEQMG